MVDVNLNVPALEKLVDYSASGIGAVAGPMLASWKARKEAEARLIESRATADNLKLIATAQAEAQKSLAAPDQDVRGVLEIDQDGFMQRIEFQERKRQANIVSVVREAAAELGDKEVPDHEPDPDWTARFFNEVQDVSSEEMQALWGRVLAGQVRKPGTTSMRTLGILKDIDVTTAQLFSRLCSAAVYLKGGEGEIFDARVPSLGGDAGQNSIAEYGLNFGQLNRLNEHGLIISDYNSFNTYVFVSEPDKGQELDLYHQGVCWDWTFAEQKMKRKTVKLHGVAMTVAGSEMSRVVTPQPIAEYTKALRTFLQDKFGISMKQTKEVGSPDRG